MIIFIFFIYAKHSSADFLQVQLKGPEWAMIGLAQK